MPGGSGVTIFFSISGFIIAHLLLRERERSGQFDLGGFYRRRLRKIGPPFLLIIVIPTLVYAGFKSINWSDFASQIFFVFNWTTLDHEPQVLPGSGVVWSLAIEEQFYIGFSLVWLAMVRASRRPELPLAVVAAGVVLYSTVARFVLSGESDRIYFSTDTRIDGMALGILTAVLLRAATRRQTSWPGTVLEWISRDAAFVLAVGLYLASLLIRDPLFRDTMRYSLQSVASCIIILWGFGAQAGSLRRSVTPLLACRPVQIVGLASYSIYLVHLPLIHAIDAFWAPSRLVGLPVSIVVGVGAGIAIYYLIERPIADRQKESK